MASTSASALVRCGTEDGIERITRADADNPGYFTFGPYLRLPPGRYRVTLRYASPALPAIRIGSWDVCVATHHVLKLEALMRAHGAMVEIQDELLLTRVQSGGSIEVWTYLDAVADLQLSPSRYQEWVRHLQGANDPPQKERA